MPSEFSVALDCNQFEVTKNVVLSFKSRIKLVHTKQYTKEICSIILFISYSRYRLLESSRLDSIFLKKMSWIRQTRYKTKYAAERNSMLVLDLRYTLITIH